MALKGNQIFHVTCIYGRNIVPKCPFEMPPTIKNNLRFCHLNQGENEAITTFAGWV
jgi:hypothetical protein